MTYITEYLSEVAQITQELDTMSLEHCVQLLANTRDRNGRVFVLGVGGSAANASHAVNDLRKIAHIEAYAPTDNVAELTARTNDSGWESVFQDWLKCSHLRPADLLLVLSVNGGNIHRNLSVNLCHAIMYAKTIEAMIISIVGRDDGYAARSSDVCVVIPTINPEHITPHAESFQTIIWHLLVNHPLLATHEAILR